MLCNRIFSISSLSFLPEKKKGALDPECFSPSGPYILKSAGTQKQKNLSSSPTEFLVAERPNCSKIGRIKIPGLIWLIYIIYDPHTQLKSLIYSFLSHQIKRTSLLFLQNFLGWSEPKKA